MTAEEARKAALQQWIVYIKPYEELVKKILRERIQPEIQRRSEAGAFYMPFVLHDSDIPEELVNAPCLTVSDPTRDSDKGFSISARSVVLSLIGYVLGGRKYKVFALSRSDKATDSDINESAEGVTTPDGVFISWGDIRDFDINYRDSQPSTASEPKRPKLVHSGFPTT